MALKDRIRSAISRKSTISSSSSSKTTSTATSGLTTPTMSSPTQSTIVLPTLLPSTTATSSKKSLTLSKTTSSSASSRFSLSRYRSRKEEDWIKYAPKNYKFYRPDPERVARLTAWEWGLGGRERGSISSTYSCVSPYTSRKNSVAK